MHISSTEAPRDCVSTTKITTHTFKNFATAERKYLFSVRQLLSENHSNIMYTILLTLFTLTLSTLFHSLRGNTIEDSGATALAEALRVNHSLETLK